MSRIVVTVEIDRTPQHVWSDVRDIASHASWMQDAEAIRFLTERTEGVGTRFECDTRVGPLRLRDLMEITAWEDGRRIGVIHSGLVTGTGEFTLAETPGGGTSFRWEEDLRFPWWLGGPLGEVVGAPVLRLIWRKNLQRLKARIESQPPRAADR